MSIQPLPTGSVRDFDFLAGRWTVSNRRLRERLVGCDEWEAFPATSQCFRLMDGVVNVDEIRFPTRGNAGTTVRTFDLVAQRWSIYWISGTDGILTTPVVGGFEGDQGVFLGDEPIDGRMVTVRFLWTRIGTGAARWEQAFSIDGGETWETNWTMAFERMPE